MKASGETTRALDGDTDDVVVRRPQGSRRRSPSATSVDLGKLQGVRQIELQTPTPGFRVEIYATDETELPPDILDTRWSHIKDVSNVGAKDDGKQKIVLGAGTSKYRNVLLWFTQPPTDGAAPAHHRAQAARLSARAHLPRTRTPQEAPCPRP